MASFEYLLRCAGLLFKQEIKRLTVDVEFFYRRQKQVGELFRQNMLNPEKRRSKEKGRGGGGKRKRMTKILYKIG